MVSFSFLTSRPELSIQLGFKNISTAVHQHIVLQDVVHSTTTQHNVLIFLEDTYEKVCSSYNLEPLSGNPLHQDQPGDRRLQALVDMAIIFFTLP